MWINIKQKTPSPNETIIAYDEIGKSIGTFDGWCFESFKGGYSWDVEYSETEYECVAEGTDEIVGRITHWMEIPPPPTSDNNEKG